jgi:hypothetical protein
MVRKTLIAVVAAVTMAIGFSAAIAPAEAYHRKRIYISIGVPVYGYYGHYRGHRHGHCHVFKVKRYGKWRKVRQCHRHSHRHPHHR